MSRERAGTPHDELASNDDEGSGVQVSQRHYQPNEHEELTTTIIVALADAMNVEPMDVREPTLYECVDAAALEAAFFEADGRNPSRNGDGSVEFSYSDYLVKVQDDGWVRVYGSVENDP